MPAGSGAPTLVVAALSVRLLAESARAAGYDVVALDAFGDRDTRAAARRWRSIRAGDASLRVDGDALARALLEAVHGDAVAGWVYGAGVEPVLSRVCAQVGVPAPIGTASAAVEEVRDPRRFFDALRSAGIAHPETRAVPPPGDTDGWLAKDFGGSGGWHVRPWRAAASAGDDTGSRFAQRRIDGEAVSALFVADERRTRVVGVQRQRVHRIGRRPYVFRGVVGPVDVGYDLRRRIDDAVTRAGQRFALRGLASVDFVVAGGVPLALEINPRPSASLALHDDARGTLMRCHVAACRGAAEIALPPPAGVRGTDILFAERDIELAPSALDAIASRPWCHDIPFDPQRVRAGDPICSVAGEAAAEAEVCRLLDARREELLSLLKETR